MKNPEKNLKKILKKIYFRACILRARVYIIYHKGEKVIRSNRKHKTQETAERKKKMEMLRVGKLNLEKVSG